MKNRIRLLFIACLAAGAANAQNPLAGRIIDRDKGTPIPGATIRLSDGRQTVSDGEGRFLIGRMPAGRNGVNISSIGYRTLDTTLSPGSDRVLSLQRLHALMAPIEILAVRASSDAPFTQTTLHARDIERNNLGPDIPFLLNLTPSVVVHSDAGNGVGYTGIRIRGTDATRINMTLNGIPYNDAESQGVFFVNLPDFASSVDNLQVQRGVGTSSNGTGAFGATLNLNTNETREQAYAELSNGFGSFNTWRHTVKLGSGLIDDRFTFDARLSRIASDGFIDRASSDLQSFYLSGAWLTDRSSLRMNVFSGKEKTYQAWYGIPESKLETDRTFNPAGTERPGEPYDNETDNYRQTHYQLFYNRSLNKRLSLQSALFYTRGLGYYEQYKADEDHADYGAPHPVFGRDTVFKTDLVRQLWLDNHFFGQTFSLQYKDDRQEIIGGGGGTRYIGYHYGKVIWAQQGFDKDHRWYDRDAYKNDINLYVKWQRKLNERMSLFTDLQYRHVTYELNGFRNNPALLIDNRWNFLNPKAGLSYRLPKGRAYLSWAVANKEPNRDDFEAGVNQQPVHETLHDFEAGYERSGSALSWGLTGYYMRYRNQLVLTGMINDVGAYARTNIPNSFRAGVEAQARWRPKEWFDATGNVTFSRNRILGLTAYYDDYDNGGQKSETFDRTPISFSPDVTAAAAWNLRPLQKVEISLLQKYVSRQYLDNTGRRERSLDPYLVHDLRFVWMPSVPRIRETSLTFQINNLFNVRYEPNGYTYSYQYGGQLTTENFFFPMAGIHFMTGLTFKW